MGPRGSSLPSLGGQEGLLEKVMAKLNLKRYVVVPPEERNWGKVCFWAKEQYMQRPRGKSTWCSGSSKWFSMAGH